MTPSIPREILSLFLKSLAVVFTIILLSGLGIFFFSALETVSDGECNIAVYPVKGIISPYSIPLFEGAGLVSPDAAREFVSTVNSDPLIQGIMYEIDSPGGTPVASEQLREIIADTELPTVALIGDFGTSGAYLAALGADTIIASPFSTVGSIGVTMSYTENSEKNAEDGITFVDLRSAPLKDGGNPDKPLTEEERVRFQAELDDLHNTFVEIVANERGFTFEEAAALADGGSYTGNMALEKKLIDQVGNRTEVRKAFAEELGLSEDDIKFCEYPVIPFF